MIKKFVHKWHIILDFSANAISAVVCVSFHMMCKHFNQIHHSNKKLNHDDSECTILIHFDSDATFPVVDQLERC